MLATYRTFQLNSISRFFFCTSLESASIRLMGRQPQNDHKIYRNYVIPKKPTPIHILTNYLWRNHPEYSHLEYLQAKVKFKNLTPLQLSGIKPMKSKYNQSLINQLPAHEKLVQIIKTLPTYYSMIILFLQVKQPIDKIIHMIKEQQINEISTENYLKGKIELENKVKQVMTSQTVFYKINNCHPFIRKQVLRKYEEIHNEQKIYKSTGFKAYRLPILYFRHPYELYLVRAQELRGLVLNEQMILPSKLINQYDNLWQNLQKQEKTRCENEASLLINEYWQKIRKCQQNTQIKQAKLLKMMKRQYSVHPYATKIMHVT